MTNKTQSKSSFVAEAGDADRVAVVSPQELDAFVYDTATVSYMRVLRGTSLIRVPAVIAIVVIGMVAANGDQLRVLLQCLPMLVGILLSMVHTWPKLLEAAMRPLPNGFAIHLHRTRVQGVAEIDVPGALEGAGAVLTAALILGPWPVEMSVTSRTALAVLTSVYATAVFTNILLHNGWWRPAEKYGHSLSWLGARVDYVPIFLGVLLPAGVDVWIIISVAAGTEFEVVGLCVAALTPFLVFLAVGVVRVYLGGARQAFATAALAVRLEAESAVHAMNPTIKNIAAKLEGNGESGEPEVGTALMEARHLSQVQLGECRDRILSPPDRHVKTDIASLAAQSMYRVPGSASTVMTFGQGATEVNVSGGDWTIAGIVLANLTANAVGAAQRDVHVDAARDVDRFGAVHFSLRVSDDGAGLAESVLQNPRTSLHALRKLLSRQYGGSLDLQPPNSPWKTVLEATWESTHEYDFTASQVSDSQPTTEQETV